MSEKLGMEAFVDERVCFSVQIMALLTCGEGNHNFVSGHLNICDACQLNDDSCSM